MKWKIWKVRFLEEFLQKFLEMPPHYAPDNAPDGRGKNPNEGNLP